MDYKLFGAVLIILGCGGFGFSLAAGHKREERCLKNLIGALNFMECELQYRLTPLPELCRKAGEDSSGVVGEVLLQLSQELDSQVSPDAGSCMCAALALYPYLPRLTENNLLLLGHSLGKFDLNGQISGLESVRASCRENLEGLSNNRENRLRSYETLGLCAGAALAILLI